MNRVNANRSNSVENDLRRQSHGMKGQREKIFQSKVKVSLKKLQLHNKMDNFIERFSRAAVIGSYGIVKTYLTNKI
uniref:Uncharacterized protein n=1 Tax=Heterorhabditis bacteriophora TaxID=37862 RepID=A0A1I7XMD7_HETBA